MPDRFELHRTRMQKGIDLTQITASTALNPAIVTLIDEGRFEELPPGVYARSYVRSFAKAVGVPADEALACVHGYLRPTEDPIPALLDRAPKSPFEGFWTFMASQARPYPAVEVLVRGASVRRAAAATVDALLLTCVGLAIVGGTAWVSGVGVQRTLEAAGVGLALMFSVPIALYFSLLEGLHVPTVGKVVCGSGASTLHGRGVRIRRCSYGRHTPGRTQSAETCRDAGGYDRRAEHLALRGAPTGR